MGKLDDLLDLLFKTAVGGVDQDRIGGLLQGRRRALRILAISQAEPVNFILDIEYYLGQGYHLAPPLRAEEMARLFGRPTVTAARVGGGAPPLRLVGEGR